MRNTGSPLKWWQSTSYRQNSLPPKSDPQTKESIDFFVVEETQVNGTRYFFVTEEEDGDCDAYILKEVATEDDDVVCEMVDDDTELAAVGKIFSELIEDADIEYERE